MNPISLIINDRAEARKTQDANADICFLALASPQGKVSVRTLVLRDISNNKFTLFVNQTSPKWLLLSDNADYELLLWYPSQQKQYRIRGDYQILDSTIVKSNWHRRPHGSKYLDYVYKEFAPQSSQIESRQILVDEIRRLKSAYNVDELSPPDEVAGVELIATSIDMLDLNVEDRIHNRQLFTFADGEWTSAALIP